MRRLAYTAAALLLGTAGVVATAQTAPRPRPIRPLVPIQPAPPPTPTPTQSGNFTWQCVDVLRVVGNYSFSFQCVRDTGDVVMLEVSHGYDETGQPYAADKVAMMSTLDAERALAVGMVVTAFFNAKSANPNAKLLLYVAGSYSKSEPGKPRVGSATLRRPEN